MTTNLLVITLDQGTKQQRDAISEYVVTKFGAGWWHWFQDVWLIANTQADATPKTIYSDFAKLPTLKGASVLIMKFNEGPLYAGFGPKGCGDWFNGIGVSG